jgi:8-oxo-dGTP pyrophosphatase MutT (NUDIX family)
MSQKWSIESTCVIHADEWIDVRAERVRTAKGAVLDPYYVLHYPDWVHIVALTPDDRLLLLRQYRHAARESGTELPCGIVDMTDADIRSAAQRELLEETGFVAADLRLVASLRPNPATHTNRVHTFLAIGAVKTSPPCPQPGEELEIELWRIPEVLEGLSHGLVSQSMHVASIFLALVAYQGVGQPRPLAVDKSVALEG